MILSSRPKIQKIWENIGDEPVKIHEIAKKFKISYNTALKYLLILVAERKADMVYSFGSRVFVKKHERSIDSPSISQNTTDLEMSVNEQ